MRLLIVNPSSSGMPYEGVEHDRGLNCAGRLSCGIGFVEAQGRRSHPPGWLVGRLSWKAGRACGFRGTSVPEPRAQPGWEKREGLTRRKARAASWVTS